jgi:hypothetical protein
MLPRRARRMPRCAAPASSDNVRARREGRACLQWLVCVGWRWWTLTLPRVNPRDARSARMAPHHVDLRRACPAPVGQLTSSAGECDLKMNPTQAKRTRSKLRYCFSPRERLTTERRNSIGIGKAQSVLGDYARSAGRRRQCWVDVRSVKKPPGLHPFHPPA